MEIEFKTLIQYLSAIALVLFFLIYMPWTALSAFFTLDPGLIWVYYFTLVLGLLFPLYYAIGEENMAWYVLGLSILINGGLWMAVEPAQAAAAAMILVVGLLFFLGPLLEPRVPNWDLVRNLFHFLKGLLIIVAAGFHAAWVLDDFIGSTSINHAMPQFLYMGGGIFVVFGIVLMLYGLFNLFKMYLGETIGGYFGQLAKIFYMLMVLVFLLGVTHNVGSYTTIAFATNPWGASTFSASIQFFANMFAMGATNLGAILLIILYIYGMWRITDKFQ